jgi:type I restriction enzyme R subunit
VDIEDLKFVVLFRPIGSMIEFKQIIGRGTRLYPDKDKTSFEIVDYVGATAHFSDPTFDGYPVHITVEEVDDHGAIVGIVDPTDGPGPEDPGVEEPEPPFVPHDPPGPVPDPPPGPTPPSPGWTKYYVDDGTFTIESEARLVPDRSNGGIVLTEYGQFVRSRIRAVGTEAELTRTWASASSRHQLQNMLASDGIDLAELSRDVGADDVDPLDVLFQLAWNAPVQTRRERVAGVRARHHAEIEAMTTGARNILEGLLQRYEAYGVSDLESAEVFRLDPLRRLGSPLELAIAAGGGDRLRAQLDLVQEWLYA